MPTHIETSCCAYIEINTLPCSIQLAIALSQMWMRSHSRKCGYDRILGKINAIAILADAIALCVYWNQDARVTEESLCLLITRYAIR
ncbi:MULTISPECIES: hypothetical protein [Cyanophyceae]|uniref:hypothetical protein n=1 Tax=Cyanophyceae TaxID=3028117 RepID=UPI0016895C33|nr:hypothetical protein [Trichocoleus sp. FACHB-40]MBD2003051.1 hypothetical protein [Trichocoleus sp. FACHB-40]